MRKLSPILLVSLVFQCAYFNTFYNASQSFNRAEGIYRKQGNLTPDARQEYDKVIKKCSKILQFHPNSKYVDDALYMLAVSYLRKKERGKSKKKFEELLQYFPDAPQKYPVYLELGRLYLEESNYAEAESYLLKALNGPHPGEAQYLLAKTKFLSGKDKEVIDIVNEFTKKYPKSRFLKEMLFFAAKSAHRLEDIDDARKYLSMYLKGFLTTDEEKKAKLLQSEIALLAGETKEALDILNSLDLPPADPDAMYRDILKARVYATMGDTTQAKSTLRKVLQVNPNSDYGLQAQYELALLLESQDSLKLALDYYSQVSKTPRNTIYKDRAKRRYEAISQLQQVKSEQSPESMYRLAELNLFELSRPAESAKILTELVNKFPDSEYTPKALYTLVYIYSTLLNDSNEASKYYKELQQRYPNSLYWEEARVNFEKTLNKNTKKNE